GHRRLPGSCPMVQEPGAEGLIQINALPQAFAVAGASSVARRPGRHRPAIAAISDSAAATPIAGLKPALNASGEPKLPAAANTATCTATPNTPPRKRDMLKVPEALPISLGATALSTAFWAAGIAIDTPAPARISGAIRLTYARPGAAIRAIQAIPTAC